MAHDTSTPTFPFDLVSPEKLLFSQQVEMVVIPGVEGDMGVLAGHAPTVTTLRPGLIEITQPGYALRRLFVEGGVAEITPERSTVLADTALDLAEVNHGTAIARLQEARDVLAAAQSGGDSEAIIRAEAQMQAAEALLLAVG